MRASQRAELVLVGGGHAHVQVLRALADAPWKGVHTTLIVDQPVAVYSGMVPAWMAGEVARHALEIDVLPLARRAGAAVIVAPVTRLAPNEVHVPGRPAIRFDVASVNLGSTVAGADRPDVRAFAIASRPIATLLDRFQARVDALASGPRRPLRVVTVGAGAGGVEVAACTAARLRGLGFEVSATLVSAHAPGWASQPRVAAAIRRALSARAVEVVEGRRCEEVLPDGVRLDDGSVLPADVVLWVAGPAAHPLARDSGLPVDARGWIRVDEDLGVVGIPGLFAVGDCAVMDAAPWVPRAGVYAVRQGPVLVANLQAALAGRATRRYRPQRDFLSMLNLGDGTAVVAKWGFAAQGAWVHRWKERIDRRFMQMFQVLEADGAPAMAGMAGADDMACGGCAAKVDAAGLERALCALPAPPDGVGLAARDDVAVVRHGGADVLATVDGFPAFTDDPWLVGRAAALNATSDVWAKGGRPLHALCWLVVPDDVDGPAMVATVMAGVQTSLDADGVVLVGGHTTVGRELLVGLTVLGDPPGGAMWLQDGAAAGDALVLTRALGTGVLWRADRMGLAAGPWMEEAKRRLLAGNRRASEVARGFAVHAATDVTGFGLVGHALGLLRHDDLALRVDVAALPLLPGVAGLLARGLRSTAHAGNRAIAGWSGELSPAGEVVFDPQTCGGLLFAVASRDAEGLVAALRAAGEADAVVIGWFEAGPRGLHLEGG